MPAKRKAPRISLPITAIEIAVTALQISEVIQPREEMDHEVVETYATLYREQEDGEPDPLPALDVFQIDGAYFVADGFHRHAAALLAQRATLPCAVFQGTMQDALRHAALANLQHGLQYTYHDKQRVLERLLTDPEVGQRSDRAIAKMMGYTHVTVGRARQRLAHVATLTETLRAQPTTATTPGAQRQEQVAALLGIPIEDTAILAKHHDFDPAEIVQDLARRMADRTESPEKAIQAVASQLRSTAALRRDLSRRTTMGWAERPRETKQQRAERQAEAHRWERSRKLSYLLDGFYDYLPRMPSAEEVAAGEEPYTPELTVEEMVAAVADKEREDILWHLEHAQTFLDAVKAACQDQGWTL